MLTTLRGWWRNADDRLELMWTEPLSFLVLGVAAVWIVYEARKRTELDLVRSFAIAGLGLWLVAAFSITIYPMSELEAPAAVRFEFKNFIPLMGTVEAFLDADGYTMSEEEWLRRQAELAEEMGVPLEEVNLDRKVHGPGLTVPLKDVLGNVALFLPLGFLAAWGWERMRSYRSVLLAGAAISGAIELSQLLFGLGSVGTVDDVIFNATGTAIGLLLFRIAADVGSRLRSVATAS